MYAIHEIATALGRQKCKALLFFHAFTGCDTTDLFSGVGKKKAWETWNFMPEMTPIFARLGSKEEKNCHLRSGLQISSALCLCNVQKKFSPC